MKQTLFFERIRKQTATKQNKTQKTTKQNITKPR